MFELPEVQVHQAGDGRRFVSAARLQGRNRGEAFYGCSEYPNCNVVYWDKPVLETCPDCNAPFLLEKTTKKQGTFRYCANEDCPSHEKAQKTQKVS
jgi:ssDNA-binding Zn-finger/Zn-ribbon topoisomerase 1